MSKVRVQNFTKKEDRALIEGILNHGQALLCWETNHKQTNRWWNLIVRRVNAVGRHSRTLQQCCKRLMSLHDLAVRRQQALNVCTRSKGRRPHPTPLSDTDAFLISLDTENFNSILLNNGFEEVVQPNLSVTERKRKASFSKQETQILMNALRTDGAFLIGRSGNQKLRYQRWAKIVSEVNATGRRGRLIAECHQRVNYMMNVAKRKAHKLQLLFNSGQTPLLETELTEDDHLLLSLVHNISRKAIPGGMDVVDAQQRGVQDRKCCIEMEKPQPGTSRELHTAAPGVVDGDTHDNSPALCSLASEPEHIDLTGDM
ncbi:uncharacterized protein LOC122803218 [Protopterus annectens]|uniref:uncharacterized protein LOC122803218 n=1 Tax=Protopterus annectens TaxID=7888 RepID=UPI001CF9F8A4|nr:uncharacterized protein LOC122803218 [Protopterus annectens]